MVAVGERTGPLPLPHPIQPTHLTQLSSTLHPYGPIPLLAIELYEPWQNIREWLQDLSLLLVSVPPHEHMYYLLRFLSLPAHRLAFDAALTPTSDFQIASEVLLQPIASLDAMVNQLMTSPATYDVWPQRLSPTSQRVTATGSFSTSSSPA
ncbi:hypothetical protein SprV_0100125300 [Sparganum proliferum]